MHVEHDEESLRLRVVAMAWEAEGVLSVHLRRPHDGDLPAWRPGAHLDLHLPGVITRQYSLCGDPRDRSTWRIAVLREQDSKGGSRAVHETLRPGDLVDVVGPRNNFAFVESESYFFIAGGIGITPLLPMLAEAERSGARWSLLYGGRTRASMAFLAGLAEHEEKVTVRPQDEFGLLDVASALGKPQEDTQVYCCGPEPLIAAVEEMCEKWPRGALHVERFAARPREAADPAGEAPFELVLARTGRTLTVEPGQSILQALEATGLDRANSCRDGVCGTCETAVLEGIPDHRDSLLDEDEKAANDTMMVCVGRALSSKLVLDL
jgi:ferredoxin-NADP reductase